MISRFLRNLRETLENARILRDGRRGESELEGMSPPCIIAAPGGSTPPVVASILEQAGVWLGSNVDPASDSEDIAHFLRRWIPSWHDWQEDGVPAEELDRMRRDFLAALVRHRVGIAAPEAGWAIMNPCTAYILPFLERAVPGFRFVHVVRDGRDMAFSANQRQLVDHGDQYLRGRGGEPGPIRSMRLWNRINREAMDYGERELGDRYIRLRFEDFCDEPIETTRRLFDFLEIAGEPERTVQAVKRPSSIGSWRQQEPEVMTQLEEIAGDLLTTFGYSLSSER